MALTRLALSTLVQSGLNNGAKHILQSQVAPAASHKFVRHNISRPGREGMFRQLFDGRTFTFSFLLADSESKEAIIIDPVLEQVERDAAIIKEMGLDLKYAINTHVHADHVTGSGPLKRHFPECKSVVAETKARADVYVEHQDVIEFGKFSVEARATPGHTNGCMSFVWHEKNMAFTGDTLLIRGCGRTDFPQGNPRTIYESCHQQILSLPDTFVLYPGHDYKGRTATSVEEEKKYNARLTKDEATFVDIMNNLKLPYPMQIDRAIPANLNDGFEEGY